jgi:hypothetical protein
LTVKAYSYLRFSSGKQAKGSSLERQFESAKAYSDKQGLELDTSLRPDSGLSGYTGKNRQKGSLGDFLRMVNEGRVERGSYLLVEYMDRLSREGLTKAAHQLLGLALAGIRVVTINDGMVFDDHADLPTVLHAVLKMDAANQYSATLADRVSKGHARRKKQAREEGRIYSKTGPSWLHLNADRKWEEIPDCVRVVRKVFDMADHRGMGATVIAQTLNADGEKPFRQGVKWHQMTVLKLLKNRMVLGEYQPRFASGEPDGEAKAGYYGAGIIDPAQFHRVNRRIELSAKSKRGRRSSATVLNDLFQGLGKCTTCGGTVGVHVRSKDKRFLYYCNDAGVVGCTNRRRFRRDEIEATLLRTLTEVEIENAQPESLDVQALERAQAARADLGDKAARMLEDIADEPDKLVRKALRERYALFLAEIEDKDEEIAALHRAFQQANARRSPIQQQDTLREFAENLDGLEGVELYEARTRLSAALKELVDYAIFYPDGFVEFILLGGASSYRIAWDGEFLGEAKVLKSLLNDQNQAQYTQGNLRREKAMMRI